MEKTIAVFSTKHGVGCSTIAWNLGLLLGQKIYEPTSGLLTFFGQVRLKNDERFLYADKIGKYKFVQEGGVYDCGNHLSEAEIRRILKKSDVVIIPTFYDHMTIINTVASLKIAYEVNPELKVILVFNRLLVTDERREKSYSQYALDRIRTLSQENGVQFTLNIQYIRHNFTFFRFMEGGQYLLDQFLSESEFIVEKKHSEWEYISGKYDFKENESISLRFPNSQKIREKNIEHLKDIEYTYSIKKRIPDVKSKRAFDETLYSRKATKDNGRAVRDVLYLVREIYA